MITATQRRTEQQQKAATEGAQFRGILWQTAEALAPGETLTVYHDSQRTWGEHHLTATFTPVALADEAQVPEVAVELGHIGAHPMVEVGWRYRRGNERERLGLKKVTPTWVLREARQHVTRARHERQQRAAEKDAALEAKQAAEQQLGFSLGSGYSFDLVGTGLTACRAWRNTAGDLRLTVKIEGSFSPDQITRLQAILLEAK